MIYADGGHGEQQYTVITSLRAALKGKRIVRGREAECAAYYGTGYAVAPGEVAREGLLSPP